MQSNQQPVTQLLAEWRGGSERAFAQLSSLLYEDLRELAHRHLRRERANHTIQKTALVNEAFLRLVAQQSADWQSRAHFFGLASKLMRRILVDYARARTANKRGGGAHVVSLDEMEHPLDEDSTPDTTPTALQHLDAHTQDDVAAIDAALKAVHPYETYELVVLPIEGGNEAYLRWIADSVAG